MVGNWQMGVNGVSVVLTVVAWVVGALALYETVLPWVFSEVRKWRRRARETRKARAQLPSESAKVDAPANDAAFAVSDSAADATEKGDSPKVEPSLATSEYAKSAYCAGDLRSNEVDANRLWEEARGMAHRFRSDWKRNQEYLAKVYGAARLGHLEAMTKLGDYAYRRGALVEAYYWTALAEL